MMTIRSQANSPEAYIRRVLFDMTEKDFIWLDKAVKGSYTGESAKDVIDKAVTGVYTIWRIQDEEGILVTWKDNETLWLGFLATSDYLNRLPHLDAWLTNYGRQHGCSRLMWSASRKALYQLYEKEYGLESARIYEQEI